jgi:hypothetical protein
VCACNLSSASGACSVKLTDNGELDVCAETKKLPLDRISGAESRAMSAEMMLYGNERTNERKEGKKERKKGI